MPYKDSNKEYHKKYSKKWYIKNRVRKYALHRVWCKNNVEKVRDYLLKKDHGISLEVYNKILELQGGVCAICGKAEVRKNKNLVVDHNHKTGKIRGLLCFKCNVALGLFGDDFVTIYLAHEYLQRHEPNYGK